MSKWFNIKAIKRRSLIARNRANLRWKLDRERRQIITEADPVRFTGKIIRRVIVIDREESVREIVFYDFDRYSDRKRKLREVRALAML